MFHQILVITFKGKVGLAVQTPLLLSITTWKVHPLADLFHEQVRCGSFPLDAALIHMCHHPKLDCIYIYMYMYTHIYIYVYMYPYWGMVMNALVGICRPTIRIPIMGWMTRPCTMFVSSRTCWSLPHFCQLVNNTSLVDRYEGKALIFFNP